ncbi:MAG: phosphoglucosamine mutase [Candidatus Diapherotrites archaeon]|nr:phosphoglucosamine mutase [Candidatus Diapherotrites archaeon]
MGKLFGTDGIRGIANEFPMEPNAIVSIGKAVGTYLSKKYMRPSIVVGKDTRLSGYMVENAITSGLLSSGCDVMLVGPMPTPAISHLIKSLNCEAGIMISASHNPAEHNGIKVFDENGFKLSEEFEKNIEKIFFSEKSLLKNKRKVAIGKAQRIDDARGRYIEFVKSTIENCSLEGLRVVVDCANGAAYAIAPKVFSELGAEVNAINICPDGLNINEGCGALHPEKMCDIVKRTKANFGVAFDGDADRLIVCDEKGVVADGDILLGLFAENMLKNGFWREKAVVATKMSNMGLEMFLAERGIKLIKTDVGDRNVAEKMREQGILLGGEKSGHLLFRKYNETPDAIVAALQLAKLLKEEQKKLSILRSKIFLFPQVIINVPVREKRPLQKTHAVMKEIKIAKEILGSEGRVFVRYSGTENLARVMVEGKSEKVIKKIARGIGSAIKSELG